MFLPASTFLANTFNDSNQALLIAEDLIQTATEIYIIPAITQEYYDIIKADTSETYADLIANYIVPCLTYYTKYLVYNQQITELEKYSISKDQREAHLSSLLYIAKRKRALLIAQLSKYTFISASQNTTTRRIGGFIRSI
ncbi:MAG: hypothetical protein WCM93_12750 [Bacteroidota bacterium]